MNTLAVLSGRGEYRRRSSSPGRPMFLMRPMHRNWRRASLVLPGLLLFSASPAFAQRLEKHFKVDAVLRLNCPLDIAIPTANTKAMPKGESAPLRIGVARLAPAPPRSHRGRECHIGALVDRV